MSTRQHDDMPSILDGRLIRLMDGEVSPEERSELEHLLATSPEARARRDELARLSDVLSDGLAAETVPDLPALDLPERVRSGGGGGGYAPPGGWKAAAAIVVLMGVGLTVEPVRAFIAAGATRVIELVASPEEPMPAPVQEEPAPVASGPSSVSFVPEGPVFVVSVASAQEAGVLQITAVDGTDVAASVVDGAGESLLVLPSELRVVNEAGSVADYRVQVPRTLTRVEVRVDGVTVTTIVPGSESGSWEVELQR